MSWAGLQQVRLLGVGPSQRPRGIPARLLRSNSLDLATASITIMCRLPCESNNSVLGIDSRSRRLSAN